MFVGTVSVGLGVGLGGLWGVTSGYLGGHFDLFSQRMGDVLVSFPALVLALTLMAAFGQSISNVIVALAIIFVPGTARVVRSLALTIKEATFIEAARAIGCSQSRIIFKHMMPNCLSLLVVLFSVDIATAIIAEASLSFLGAGVPPDEASWGGMLTSAAQRYVRVAPWLAVIPGAVLSLTVFGFNLLGDGIRDLLDPRLRGR